MTVTAKNKRVVWALSGARCAICKKPLVQKEHEANAYSFLGDVAHMHARRDGGPRANVLLPDNDRDHPDNLFLLCLDHHKIIDDHPEIYTIQKLRELKDRHLSWVRSQLGKGTPWTSDIYNFYYINLPRLLMLAEVLGCGIDDQKLSHINDVSSLAGGYGAFLRLLRPVIENIHPKVVALDSLSLTDSDVGVIARFDQQFRTKGLGKVLTDGFSGFTGDLSRDPHIYTQCNGYKFAMPIDPRWLTTTTAGVHLSSGQGSFSGICIVNFVDDERKLVLCSPLLLGHPKRW